MARKTGKDRVAELISALNASPFTDYRVRGERVGVCGTDIICEKEGYKIYEYDEHEIKKTVFDKTSKQSTKKDVSQRSTADHRENNACLMRQWPE